MNTFAIGQCWMSESEPELGLGFVFEVTMQQVAVRFPEAKQERRYGKRSAPLKRISWLPGDRLKSKTGKVFVVERVETRGELFWYVGEGQEVKETDVTIATKVMGPVGRLLGGQWDAPLAYELRRQTLSNWSETMSSPVRGLLGPRVELIPHQVYVVSEIVERSLPRVLLADEVGLGKTIEAGWIAHQLLVTGRMSRVLVLAPKAMVNQWFVEMRRRFNLGFRVPESEDFFDTHPQLILSLEALADDDVCALLLEAEWDLVIVDEAHRVSWTPESPSREYLMLEALSAKAGGLLLLTATPEQLGVEGHFGRLRLLDPQRFTSYDDYLKEHDRYAQVAKKAAKLDGDELRELIDRHGTGRVYFRNARKVVEAESYRFPKRILRPHPLASAEARLPWLKKILEENPSDKFLLICSTRKQVEELDAQIKTLVRLNTAVFHEGQSVVVRDRSAAYFAEPQGARILFSSEIGSEGRNFQFARHLILWDLPLDTDLLEQRIGRLDRIGQRDEFMIHVPFVKGSDEERLFKWYDEVFGIFEAPAPGAAEIHARFWPKGSAATAAVEYGKRRKALDEGRDRLIELNSFNSKSALERVARLKNAERSDVLRDYMESVFSWVGVNEEDLDEDSVFVEPGDSMFIPSFPGLPDEGVRITYSRKKALEREDLSLLSWDHPMVRQIMETIVGQEFGSACVARWKTPKSEALVECHFVLQCATAPEWYADEFFSPLPLRVLLNAQGQDVSARWPVEKLAAETSRMRARPEDFQVSPLRLKVKDFCEQALKLAGKQAQAHRVSATEAMSGRIDAEIKRLKTLAKQNGLVSERELARWMRRKEELAVAFAASEIRLDSVRVVF